jgi:hypothetical protein
MSVVDIDYSVIAFYANLKQCDIIQNINKVSLYMQSLKQCESHHYYYSYEKTCVELCEVFRNATLA